MKDTRIRRLRGSSGPDLRGALWLCLALLLPCGVSVAASQEDDARSKVEAELQLRINEAISRGVDSLLRQQEIDGSWKDQAHGYRNGQTALCLYTLLKCDVQKDHPTIRRAVEFLRAEAPVRTYSAALQLMALCALDAEEHREWIAEVAEELESWQRGGFGYPDAVPDLSNTQYAAMGLRAAANEGHKVNRKSWERLVKWTLALQQVGELGGFRYHGEHELTTGSMTSAGLSVLAICMEQLPRPDRALEPALERGARWLTKHFEIARNPHRDYATDGPAEEPGHESYYYVYGLERVGALLGASHFGQHDWYREGATWLLEKQDEVGRWGNQSDTCFALLFLARATARETFSGPGTQRAAYTYGEDSRDDAVSVRAAGRGPIKIWVSSFGEFTVEDYGWGAEGSRELHVERVEYRVEDPGAEEGSLLLASIPGDPLRPTGIERYAARLEFDISGTYRIFARVHLRLPPELVDDEGGSEPGDALHVVESPVLDVDVLRVDDALLDQYSGDARNNRLRSPRTTARTSSRRDDQHQGLAAIDGRVGSQWFSAKDDPRPSITFEVPRPVRADLLLLTLASDDPGGIPPRSRDGTNSPAAITKVAVTLNDSKERIEVTVDPNPRRKVLVPLGRMAKVRTITIEVLEVRPGGREDQGVGFAEVELLVRKERERR